MQTLTVDQLLAAARKKRARKTKDWLERAKLVLAAARDRAAEMAQQRLAEPSMKHRDAVWLKDAGDGIEIRPVI